MKTMLQKKNQEIERGNQDYLSQLNKCCDIALSDVEGEKKQSVTKMLIDGAISFPAGKDDFFTKLRSSGFRVNDKDQICFFVIDFAANYNVHYTNIFQIRDEVAKKYSFKFPLKREFSINRKEPFKPTSFKRSFSEIAESRGSLLANETRHQYAKDNLEQAVKNLKWANEVTLNNVNNLTKEEINLKGYNNLVDVFTIELQKESKILEYAQSIDWESVYLAKEMSSNKEVLQWDEERKKSSSHYDELHLYSISVWDYRICKQNNLLDKNYNFEQIKILCKQIESNLAMGDYKILLQKEIDESNSILKERFSRKDGKGFKEPTLVGQKTVYFRELRNVMVNSYYLNVLNKL